MDTSSPIPESFGHYLAAWNEPDPDRVRGHLDRCVAGEVLFVDPANTTVGPVALEALIREAKAAMPDAVYALASGIDGHHRRFRYRWEVRVGGDVIPGMDVVTVDEQERIERIDGFFGDFASA